MPSLPTNRRCLVLPCESPPPSEQPVFMSGRFILFSVSGVIGWEGLFHPFVTLQPSVLKGNARKLSVNKGKAKIPFKGATSMHLILIVFVEASESFHGLYVYISDSRVVMGSKDNDDSMVAIQLTVDLKPDLSSGFFYIVHTTKVEGLPKIVSIQNVYSTLARCKFELDLAEVCHLNHCNIGLLAYSPLAGGSLSEKYLDPDSKAQKSGGLNSSLDIWRDITMYA